MESVTRLSSIGIYARRIENVETKFLHNSCKILHKQLAKREASKYSLKFSALNRLAFVLRTRAIGLWNICSMVTFAADPSVEIQIKRYDLRSGKLKDLLTTNV